MTAWSDADRHHLSSAPRSTSTALLSSSDVCHMPNFALREVLADVMTVNGKQYLQLALCMFDVASDTPLSGTVI
jgi:hypothetical protein